MFGILKPAYWGKLTACTFPDYRVHTTIYTLKMFRYLAIIYNTIYPYLAYEPMCRSCP